MKKLIPVIRRSIMPAVRAGSALLALMLICIPADAQKKKKTSLKEIRSTLQNAAKMAEYFYLIPDVDMQHYSILIPHPNIFLDEKDGLEFNSRSKAIIPPGEYTFGARYVTQVEMGSSSHTASSGNASMSISYSQSTDFSFAPTEVEAVFEPGKFYTFAHDTKRKVSLKLDNIIISLEEVTDRETINNILDNAEENRAAAMEYLAWSEENPGALEGSYASVIRKGKVRMEFTGNRFLILIPMFGMEWEYEGTFHYDRNTIVLQTEKRRAGNNPQLPCDGTDILFYETTDRGIHIKGMLPSVIQPGIGVEYSKIEE